MRGDGQGPVVKDFISQMQIWQMFSEDLDKSYRLMILSCYLANMKFPFGSNLFNIHLQILNIDRQRPAVIVP